MSTIRSYLSSGVRLGVVPDNYPSHSKAQHGEVQHDSDSSIDPSSHSITEYEEALENGDFSTELEGSCELMSEVESDAGNNDETKRHNDEQRHKRVLRKWKDYLDALERSENSSPD